MSRIRPHPKWRPLAVVYRRAPQARVPTSDVDLLTIDLDPETASPSAEN